MKKNRRHEQLLGVLEAHGEDRVVSTRELAEQLDVSEMTVRRDLYELDQEGLIKRVHGGAILPQRQSAPPTKPGRIGILRTSGKDKFTDPFFSQVLEGADRRLQASGYRPEYIFSYADVHTREQARDLLHQYPTDAILLIGAYSSDSVEYLAENVRVLVTTTSTLGPMHDAILLDGVTGIREMVDHLVKLRRRRLGFITGYYDSREMGFCESIAAHNLPNDPALRVRVAEEGTKTWSMPMGQEGAEALMSQGNPPDALVCASDRLAIGAMQWLHMNGFRVPEDVAVTGFDNIADSEFTIPPLTTMHVHKQLIGSLAAERAIRRIEDPEEVPLQITTPTTMVIRQSCGADL